MSRMFRFRLWLARLLDQWAGKVDPRLIHAMRFGEREKRVCHCGRPIANNRHDDDGHPYLCQVTTWSR